MKARVNSLFSGVGTFDHGFHLAGWETVSLCEWDEKAREVLAVRFPGVPIAPDVCEVLGADLPDAECIMFGSPCQDLSVAGKHAGLAGQKSGLFLEAIRIIKEKREATGGRYPAFVVLENVPGLLSSNGGRDFSAVIHAFLDCGARDICWRVLDAQFFGVPQRRRRIFLIADFAGERAKEILFESNSVPGRAEEGGKAGQEATGTARSSTESDGWPAQVAPRVGATWGRKWGNDQDFFGQGAGMYVPDIARCLTTRNERQDACTENLLPVLANALTTQQNGQGTGLGSPRGDGSDNLIVEPIAFDHAVGFGATPCQAGLAPTLLAGTQADNGRGRIAIAFYATQEGGMGGSEHVTPPLAASDGGNTMPCIAFDFKASTQRDPMCGPISPTLEAQDKTAINTPDLRVRRLTPLECERLQGLPDFWTDVNGMPDSHRYRFLGNGGAVPVLRWVAERIKGAMQ